MVTLEQLREKVFKVYAHGQFDPPDGVFKGDGLAKFIWDELEDAFKEGNTHHLNEAYRFMYAAKMDLEEVMHTIAKEMEDEE